MDKEQKLYTLSEARKIFAEEECKIHGHSYRHEVKFGVGLVRVFCENCGRSWELVEGEKRGDR